MNTESKLNTMEQVGCVVSELQEKNENMSEKLQQDELTDRCADTGEKPPLLIMYTRGLKAMLDLLPENTDAFSVQTIDDYLWVIEQQLSSIYSLLEALPGCDPDQVVDDFESRGQKRPLSVVCDDASLNAPEY